MKKISIIYLLFLVLSGFVCNAEDVNAKGTNAASSQEVSGAQSLRYTGGWGPLTDGFQLSIWAQTNVFCQGCPMPIHVVFKNTTTNQLERFGATLEQCNNIAIRCFVENEANESDEDAMLYSGNVVPLDVFGFPPEGEVDSQVDLASYKFPPPNFFGRPGIYRLHVAEVGINHGPTNVISGTLEIKIIPKQVVGTNNSK